MMTMAKISIPFTYDIADDYLAQTNELGKTASWTYDGEDKIWVFVDKETNKLRNTHYLTSAEDGEAYPTPLDMHKVMIDCEANPLLCTLFGADEHKDYNELPQIEEDLPDGNVYARPADTTPDHTYEILDVEYDLATGEFKTPYPWKKPWMSWDDVRAQRNIRLRVSDDHVVDDMPPALKTAWEEYKQKLRDLPQVYGAASSGEIPPVAAHKVRYPTNPEGLE